MIHVVAGVLIDPEDRILIAQRPPGKHLAGFWEFPGGKLEAGEDRLTGLARELKEELGVTIDLPPRPLLRLTHHYDFGSVLLDIHTVKDFDGEPRGCDGQSLRWCRWHELQHAGLLPADRPIVRALQLPERLVRRRTPIYDVLRPDEGLGAAVGERVQPAMPLIGVEGASAEECLRKATGGVDFVVTGGALPAAGLAALCAALPLPVYARGMELREAWLLGASGVCEF